VANTYASVFLRAGVPPFEGGFAPVFTQHRDSARVEREMHAQAQFETEPAHRQGPQRMAVAEADRLIDARFADSSDHAVEPSGNLRSRLAAGHLTVPNGPTRDCFPD